MDLSNIELRNLEKLNVDVNLKHNDDMIDAMQVEDAFSSHLSHESLKESGHIPNMVIEEPVLGQIRKEA